MWLNATEADCVSLLPEQCGWTTDNDKIELFWFESEPTPLLVEDILQDEIIIIYASVILMYASRYVIINYFHCCVYMTNFIYCIVNF